MRNWNKESEPNKKKYFFFKCLTVFQWDASDVNRILICDAVKVNLTYFVKITIYDFTSKTKSVILMVVLNQLLTHYICDKFVRKLCKIYGCPTLQKYM